MRSEWQISILIGGMRDNRCRERLSEALERVHGVRHVDISLYRGVAIVSHDARCTGAMLLRAIEQAGYNASVNDRGRPARPVEAEPPPAVRAKRPGGTGSD